MTDLPGTEQLHGLSIFAGSFTSEAAEAVLAQDEVEGQQIAGQLEQLVLQGQVEAEGQGDSRRYRFSEELRQRGRAQLSASGAADAVTSRLMAYYLSQAEQMLDEAFGPERALWISRLEQEHTNLQAVFEWLLERRDAEQGLRLAYLLQELWFEPHHISEARTLLATFLGLPEASARTRTRARPGPARAAFDGRLRLLTMLVPIARARVGARATGPHRTHHPV